MTSRPTCRSPGCRQDAVHPLVPYCIWHGLFTAFLAGMTGGVPGGTTYAETPRGAGARTNDARSAWEEINEAFRRGGAGIPFPATRRPVTDFYKLLGVARRSSPEQIKRAYRRKALRWHPDRADGDRFKMAEINRAYEILSDPPRRARYDRVLEDR